MPSRAPVHRPYGVEKREPWDRNSNKRRLTGRPWMRLAKHIKERDGFECQECGRVTATGEVDHITPVSKGGTDDPSNLQYLCGGPDGCHARKTIRERGGSKTVKVGLDGLPVSGQR